MWTKGGSGVVRMTVAGRREPEREEFVQVVGINVWFCDKNSPSSMAPKTGIRFHQNNWFGRLEWEKRSHRPQEGACCRCEGNRGWPNLQNLRQSVEVQKTQCHEGHCLNCAIDSNPAF